MVNFYHYTINSPLYLTEIICLIFGVPATKNGKYLEHFIEPFYTWPKNNGETPIKLDIILIYDHTKLDKVFHTYVGRDDIKSDGFIFKEPDNKLEALKAIIKIV